MTPSAPQSAAASDFCAGVAFGPNEAAAFFAVAQFRGVEFGQLLYGGDDVGGEVWDGRGWQHQGTAREKLFWLAAAACLRL